jgi:hypothetical protein
MEVDALPLRIAGSYRDDDTVAVDRATRRQNRAAGTWS